MADRWVCGIAMRRQGLVSHDFKSKREAMAGFEVFGEIRWLGLLCVGFGCFTSFLFLLTSLLLICLYNTK
jgi:hypothetical protein